MDYRYYVFYDKTDGELCIHDIAEKNRTPWFKNKNAFKQKFISRLYSVLDNHENYYTGDTSISCIIKCNDLYGIEDKYPEYFI